MIIGGGHAGCEAAFASAKQGLRTAMITLRADRIGFMSCNPAIGGLAKGQLVKEIDALGGVMAINTDHSSIQSRRLNAKKGPAVRSSRAQCDKALYAKNMQKFLAKVEGLSIIESEATALLVHSSKVEGVILSDGRRVLCRSIVITSGTFLSAIMHMGVDQSLGGRFGDQASVGLSKSLLDLGFRLRRLKTGTPPRLNKNSINYSDLIEQPGDSVIKPFSFYFDAFSPYYNDLNGFPVIKQLNCFITYTNIQTHEIIAENLDRSPIYSGAIVGIGPRYCPSIEDKIKRFASKDRHQIFLEPEGIDVDEVYVNGVSTSLPKDVQEKFIRSIVGLEKAEFIRYGYAVEYDAIDCRQLTAGLESKDIRGLFLAGQVNGTSGYEEAGAQGLVAGTNAARYCLEKEPLILSRLDGYIGVLIDDLVLKGTDEPYRMFTSRAEYRLLIREDNADLRLSQKARDFGLLSDQQYEKFEKKREAVSVCLEKAKTTYLYPDLETNNVFSAQGWPEIKDRSSLDDLLKRPNFSWPELKEFGIDWSCDFSDDVLEQIEIQVKYAGYISRDLSLLEGLRKSDGLRIPTYVEFDHVPGLSNEIKSRLKVTRPENIGQMSRIQGVTPSAVASMMIFLKMGKDHAFRSTAD